MRTLLVGLGWLLAIYVAWLSLLFLQQRSMMFPGTGRSAPDWQQVLPPGAERWQVVSAVGKVDAVLLPAAGNQPGAPAALYFHGNAETVADNIRPLMRLAEQGVHVLLVEFPGYAGSEGRPSKLSVVDTALRAHDMLAVDPRVDAQRIAAVGRSLGSGAASALARERGLSALVLISPYTSVADIARGFGAPAFLVRDPFDNRAALKDYQGKLLILHGRRDQVIAYSHAQALQAALPQAQLLAMDCGHNDCPFFSGEALQAMLVALGAVPGDL